MSSNDEIYTALITLLNDAALGYSVAYLGYNFDPPSSGPWLEVEFFPGEGIDRGLRNQDGVLPQGIFQVAAVIRPGAGVAGLNATADQIRVVYAKGTAIAGSVRVTRTPYDMQIEMDDDRIMVVVTIEYSG
jgi:hypothetical protein